jgi:hypothetical protein
MGPRLRGDDEVNNAHDTLSQTGRQAGSGEACVRQNCDGKKIDGEESPAEAGYEEIRTTEIS